jgi:predicted methyltransferase MtxX (methanogen marker protein 4)
MNEQSRAQATGVRMAADYIAALPPDRTLNDAATYLHEFADAIERIAITIERISDDDYIAVFVDEAQAGEVDAVIRTNFRRPGPRKETPRG